MKRSTGNKRLDTALAALGVLAVWQLLSLAYPPLVVPTISGVAGKLLDIAASGKLLGEMALTFGRLAAGLGLGVAAGTALGIAFGHFPRWHGIGRPLIGLMQSVPPISWLVLALIWFGFSGRASVFIVAVGTLPAMVVSMVEGLRSVDAKLLEMGRIYGFSRWKRLRYIVMPSVLPHFRAGLAIAIGIGCKTVVMGEVLTTTNGIGGEITAARLNIEPESVVAWTVAIVVLYYLLDKTAALLLRGRRDKASHAENNRPEQGLRQSDRAGAAES